MQQLGSLAEDLLEERLRLGTASATETVALYNATNELAIANLERIRAQTAYLEAQRAKAVAETMHEETMQRAIEAMGIYSGEKPQ